MARRLYGPQVPNVTRPKALKGEFIQLLLCHSVLHYFDTAKSAYVCRLSRTMLSILAVAFCLSRPMYVSIARAQDAQDAADAAQDAADSTDQAAQDTQDAADTAQQAAGSCSSQAAQDAANATQDAADSATQAAQDAQDAADAAQEAADSN
jgi:methyl-accepting chemotaxis protein